MPYDIDKDRVLSKPTTKETFGSVGRNVTPSDTVDLDPYVKAVVALATGNLVILPTQNADGDTITFVNVPAGFSPPYNVRRVLATGTTVAVATIEN